MRFVFALLVAFACSGAFASEPGQPLDCSDWVSVRPGFTCALSDEWLRFLLPGEPRVSRMDNEGHVLSVWPGGSDPCLDAGNGTICVWQYDYRTGAREMVGYFASRAQDQLQANPTTNGAFVFDDKAGAVIVPLKSYSWPAGNYSDVQWVATIRGFATTFDVLQTFMPQPAALGFRVPYMPEGMPAADHFDTYWGELAHPLDFTQAHPLQCGYPAAAPRVGDYLTVPDNVPTPAPGQGVYYVTSATYQGATRYGRKTAAGHLTGRDPSLLPACTP